MTSASVPIVDLPFYYVNDIQIKTITNTTVQISAGQCRDSTNTYDITLPSAVTINAAVNGLNGLDTGTFAASTFYYVYVIASPNQALPVGCILSTSLTAPTMPYGYGIFRRVGSMVANSATHFINVYVKGKGTEREYFFDSLVTVLTATGNTAFTSLALSTLGAVPPTSQLAYLQATLLPATAGNQAHIKPTGGASYQFMYAPVISQNSTQSMWVSLNPTGNSIDYQTTSGSDALTINVFGYKESL